MAGARIPFKGEDGAGTYKRLKTSLQLLNQKLQKHSTI